MKIKSAVIMVLLIISGSFSQNIFVSVGSGLSVPMAESGFTDAYNLGFNAHSSLTFPLSNNVSVRGDIQYNNFPYDESSPNFGGNFTATTIKGDLIVGKFDSRDVSPYGLVGAGLYLISASITQNNVSISSSETDFGMGIGGGVNFGVSSKASIYIETQYNFIFNDGTAKGYLPIKAGVMFRL